MIYLSLTPTPGFFASVPISKPSVKNCKLNGVDLPKRKYVKKKNISFKFFLVLSCNQLLEIKYAKRYALHTVAFAPSSAVTKPFDLPHCFVADTAAPSACFSAPGMTMQSKPVVFIPKEFRFHDYSQVLFILSLNSNKHLSYIKYVKYRAHFIFLPSAP